MESICSSQPTAPDMASSLSWLAEQGATFALPAKGSKAPSQRKWQQKHHGIDVAQRHADAGGNVGLLTGEASGGIIAIDLDREFPEMMTALGPYADTVKVVRENAPSRGKLLYRLEVNVDKRSWMPGDWQPLEGEKRSPWAELIGKGSHALIPPSEFDGGRYVLKDQHFGIKTLTEEELATVWFKVTEGRPGVSSVGLSSATDLPDEPANSAPNASAISSEYDRAKAVILGSWTVLEVFEHHGRADNVVAEGNSGDLRLQGNGGLLVGPKGWYCFRGDMGGYDAISAWTHCTREKKSVRGREAWGVLREMAAAKGITLPDSRKRAGKVRVNNDDSIDNDGNDDTQTSRSKPNQAEQLCQLASELAEIFTAQNGTAYAFVPFDDHRECYRLSSNEFHGWLNAAYRGMTGNMSSKQAREGAVSALVWDARSMRRDVFLRVGAHEGNVYIDLGTPEWDAVKIDAAGWRVVSRHPVAFRRTPGLKPLPLPLAGGTMQDLRRFVNLEQDDWPLLAAWVLAALHPRGPYPVLALAGEQGTAKSTTLAVIKELIDPGAAGLRGQPTDVRDLFIGANNQWVLAFDNVSHLKNDMSDALCRIATGGGYAKRSNYTDEDEVLIEVQRPACINGIGDVVTRPDLMDRSIVLIPPVISDGHRRSEAEFWSDFHEARPQLFGSLLDAMSLALRRANAIVLPDLPRMAGFVRLAVAAEPAYCKEGEFLDAYTMNQEETHASIAESNPLCEHLLKLVSESEVWEGTATDLLKALNEHATTDDRQSDFWPSAHNKVKGALQRLGPTLRKSGVEVVIAKRKSHKRLIQLLRIDS